MQEIIISKSMEMVAQFSVNRASQVLSKLLKCGARIELDRCYFEDITELTASLAMSEEVVIASCLNLEGDAEAKFLFFTDIPTSLILTDLILQQEVGTTKEVNIYSESAVQEVSNIIGSAVGNVFTMDFHVNLKPTPPQVITEMLPIVFNEFVMDIAMDQMQILVIESKFHIVQHNLRCNMFVLPTKHCEEVVNFVSNTE